MLPKPGTVLRGTRYVQVRALYADNPGGTVLVGFDTRFEAGSFAAAAAEVLASHGLKARVSDAYLPTPALCW